MKDDFFVDYGYILNGRETVPVKGALDWAKWKQGSADFIVRLTKVRKAEVSTVFLCVDHSWGLGGRPLLFETMYFGSGIPDELSEFQDRYCTYDEAEAGHERAVEQLAKAIGAEATEIVDGTEERKARYLKGMKAAT